MGCFRTTIPVQRFGRLHVQARKRSKRKQVRGRNSRWIRRWNFYGCRVKRKFHHATSRGCDSRKKKMKRKLKTGERWKIWSVRRVGKKRNEGRWPRAQEKENWWQLYQRLQSPNLNNNLRLNQNKSKRSSFGTPQGDRTVKQEILTEVRQATDEEGR